MRGAISCGLAALLTLGGSFVAVVAQEEPVKVLDPDAGRRFLPDRVPMEGELIAVDGKNSSVLQFPSKSRVAIAALVATGLSAEYQKKYQYVLVSESRVVLGRWTLPAGMVGLSLEPETAKDAPTRALTARDFSGSEIDRILLKLDPNGKEGALSFVPSGASGFELHIGRYVIEGTLK